MSLHGDGNHRRRGKKKERVGVRQWEDEQERPVGNRGLVGSWIVLVDRIRLWNWTKDPEGSEGFQKGRDYVNIYMYGGCVSRVCVCEIDR